VAYCSIVVGLQIEIGGETMKEYKLRRAAEIVAAELKYFHHQNGGNYLFPVIKREETGSDLIMYFVIDRDSRAEILFRPTNSVGTIMTINLSDTETFSWLLGVEGRSELDLTTRIAADPSVKCEDFCNKFIDHLHKQGFFKTYSKRNSNGGRPRHEEDDWAREQILLQSRDINEIYKEWLERRKQEHRGSLADAYDSFKKIMRKSR
jgi:hypothetical protein